MSLRFRKLRKDKITQERLSEKIGVSTRTIRSWEVERGAIPSIKIMADIAEALRVTTFDIYDCFMNKPDSIDENGFKFHTHSIEEYTAKRNAPSDLFFCISNYHWYGKGILRYKSHVLNFDHIALSSAEISSDIVSNELAQFFTYYDGMIILDKSLNIIPMKKKDFKYWEIESLEFHNITIHFSVTTPVLAEMEEDINENGFADLFLTIFDYDERHEEQFFLDPNSFKRLPQEKIIGQYIRDVRHSKKIKQTDIADNLFHIIDNKQISKLEKGKLLPSPIQLSLLCSELHLSVKELLCSYDVGIYSANTIDSTNRTYKAGLNLLFDKVSDFLSLLSFTEQFMYVKNTLTTSQVIGELRFIKDNSNLSIYKKIISYYNTDENIKLSFEDGSTISFRKDCIDCISADKLNYNCVYIIRGKFHEKFHTYNFIIEMSLYMN